MKTIQLDAYMSLYGDCGIIDGTECPTCNGESVIKNCPECEGEESVECTICEGTGELEDGTECAACEGSGETDCPTCSSTGEVECPTCEGESSFEIYWNTLFGIPSYALKYGFYEAKEIAWKNGWLLLESPDGDYWLAAGSCGYDFTWVRAKCLIEICGMIPSEFVQDMSLGGHVFVSDEWAIKIAQEIHDRKRAMIRNELYEIRRFKKFIEEKQEKVNDLQF